MPAGRYDVKVVAVGLKGDVVRRFEDLEIPEGETVEKVLDFSSGDLVVGVKRNGELSDATVNIYVAGTRERVAGGRTYASEARNPKAFRLTAGTYDVEIGSVEIAGKPGKRWEGVVVEPRGRVERHHEYESGTLMVGVTRGTDLVDAVVNVYDPEGKEIDRGRTYTSEKSNPSTFVLPPGSYTVNVRVIRGEERKLEVVVATGEEVQRMVVLDPAP